VQLATLQKLASTGGGLRSTQGQAKLKAVPHFMTEIDGLDIHFIHVRSKHEKALPVIVTHGWPGSVVEQLKIIDPLTNPTAHGGTAADAFDVVIPSLPGYGYSGKPTAPGWDPPRIAKAWIALMQRLGYKKYVAQGGDWGNAVSEIMALMAPPGIARHPHQYAGYGSGGDPARRSLPAPRLRRAYRPTRRTPTGSWTSSTRRASRTRPRWGSARRRSMESWIRRSASRAG
jgi:pimeloyl-ACP methyl ester carboxylesterase